MKKKLRKNFSSQLIKNKLAKIKDKNTKLIEKI